MSHNVVMMVITLCYMQCSLILRECDAATTDAIGNMICYCCWNNQSYSACVIEELQVNNTIY